MFESYSNYILRNKEFLIFALVSFIPQMRLCINKLFAKICNRISLTTFAPN